MTSIISISSDEPDVVLVWGLQARPTDIGEGPVHLVVAFVSGEQRSRELYWALSRKESIMRLEVGEPKSPVRACGRAGCSLLPEGVRDKPLAERGSGAFLWWM